MSKSPINTPEQSEKRFRYRYVILPALSALVAILGPVTSNALADIVRLRAGAPKKSRGGHSPTETNTGG